MTDVATERVTAPAEPGDHDRFKHYVRTVDLDRAVLDGGPVLAICGKLWDRPSVDVARFPLCPDCAAIYERLDAE